MGGGGVRADVLRRRLDTRHGQNLVTGRLAEPEPLIRLSCGIPAADEQYLEHEAVLHGLGVGFGHPADDLPVSVSGRQLQEVRLVGRLGMRDPRYGHTPDSFVDIPPDPRNGHTPWPLCDASFPRIWSPTYLQKKLNRWLQGRN